MVEVELYLNYIEIIIKLLRLNLSKLLIIETVKLIRTKKRTKTNTRLKPIRDKIRLESI